MSKGIYHKRVYEDNDLERTIGKVPPWIFSSIMYSLIIIVFLAFIGFSNLTFNNAVRVNVIIQPEKSLMFTDINNKATIDTVFVESGSKVSENQVILRSKSKIEYNVIMKIKETIRKMLLDPTVSCEMGSMEENELGEFREMYNAVFVNNEIRKNDKTVVLREFYQNILNWEENYFVKSPINGWVYYSDYFNSSFPFNQGVKILFSKTSAVFTSQAIISKVLSSQISLGDTVFVSVDKYTNNAFAKIPFQVGREIPSKLDSYTVFKLHVDTNYLKKHKISLSKDLIYTGHFTVSSELNIISQTINSLIK